MEYLSIPYPDFQLHDIIEPDEFDLNNDVIVEKINEVLELLNAITDSIEDGGSGADQISITPIAPFTSTKLQSYLKEVVGRLRSSTLSTSGADFIGSSAITGVTGTTVRSQLASLKTLLDAEKTRIDVERARITKNEQDVASLNTRMSTHNHDDRYMTRTQLAPYLQGGDTLVRLEVFVITNSNNGNGTFTNTRNGAIRTGTLGQNGEQLFTLESGTYQLGLNHIKALINDTLHRSVVSGGLIEVSPNQIGLTSPEGNGTEITVEYFERIGVSGEHALSYGTNEPPPSASATMWFKVVG